MDKFKAALAAYGFKTVMVILLAVLGFIASDIYSRVLAIPEEYPKKIEINHRLDRIEDKIDTLITRCLPTRNP
jgi:tRNA(Ser,Leu) C12 N-acetylase TAN1